MKILLVLVSMVVSTYAGVGYLTQNEELNALRLYRNYCSGNSEGGNAGKTYIYCKKAREDFREDLNHVIRINPKVGDQRQVIFIQPPSYYYRHNVTLMGARAGQQRAIIYVLPPKNTHTVDHSDLRDFRQEEPLKPALFFLKSDPSSLTASPGGSSSSSGAVVVDSGEDVPSNTYPILPAPYKTPTEDYSYKNPSSPAVTKLRSGGYY